MRASGLRHAPEKYNTEGPTVQADVLTVRKLVPSCGARVRSRRTLRLPRRKVRAGPSTKPLDLSTSPEPWLSELSGLSGTIGPLSAHYRPTIGSDSGSAAIGAIGHYRGTIGPFQIVRTLRHYRTLSGTIGHYRAIGYHYRACL